MAKSLSRRSSSSGRAEALYWQGRSLEKLGERSSAKALFRKVIEQFPDGYYAAASEKRLAATPPPIAAEIIKAHNKTLDKASRRAWQRANDLQDAGLGALARRDLEASLKKLSTRQRLSLLPLLVGLQAPGLAFSQALSLSRARAISRNQLAPFLYIRGHRRLVEAEAHRHDLDPILLWSLMRQESAFDANAVSRANANGLMQLLETTARRMSSKAGMDAESDLDLFDPETNIKLGTTYLGGLMKEFDGRLVLVLAAYNAGETAARRWRDAGRRLEDDELIESISYRETRDYVKKIVRNMRNYRRLWGKGDESRF